MKCIFANQYQKRVPPSDPETLRGNRAIQFRFSHEFFATTSYGRVRVTKTHAPCNTYRFRTFSVCWVFDDATRIAEFPVFPVRDNSGKYAGDKSYPAHAPNTCRQYRCIAPTVFQQQRERTISSSSRCITIRSRRRVYKRPMGPPRRDASYACVYACGRNTISKRRFSSVFFSYYATCVQYVIRKTCHIIRQQRKQADEYRSGERFTRFTVTTVRYQMSCRNIRTEIMFDCRVM